MSNKSNIDKFATKINDMLNTYIAKNADYGDSFNDTLDEEGIIAARVRLSDKFNRFKQLSKVEEAKVNDESITDTLLDMANYAIMTVIWLENKASQKKTKDDDEEMHKHMKKFNRLPKDVIAPPWRVTCSSGGVVDEKGYVGFPEGKITNDSLREKADEIISNYSREDLERALLGLTPRKINSTLHVTPLTAQEAERLNNVFIKSVKESLGYVNDYEKNIFLATDKKHDIAEDIDAEQRYLESLKTAEFRRREYNIDTE